MRLDGAQDWAMFSRPSRTPRQLSYQDGCPTYASANVGHPS